MTFGDCLVRLEVGFYTQLGSSSVVFIRNIQLGEYSLSVNLHICGLAFGVLRCSGLQQIQIFWHMCHAILKYFGSMPHSLKIAREDEYDWFVHILYLRLLV